MSALAWIASILRAISPFPTSALAEFSPDTIQTESLGANEDLGESVAPVPEGLTVVDWAQIRREYERHRYSAVPDGEGYKARNHRQGWLIRFDGRGFSVQPDEGGWSWGLELVSYGFDGAERVVEGKAAITADKNRLSYAWDDTVEEWSINDTRGLEHGFMFSRRPAGEGERVRLRLAVRGNLRAESVDGEVVRFVNEDAAAVVNYAGLKVWDADGRPLPARLDVTSTGQVRVVVEDRGAKYPITVDPIAQQAYVKASNTDANDRFADSVAVWGDTVVVGAFLEDSNGVGVNPPSQADNSLLGSGAAYVFTGLGPPVADAGPDQLVHIPSGGTADVALDGSGSSNLGGDPLIYTWTGPFPEGGGTAMGEMAMVTLPPGVHTVTLTVDDGGGLMDSDTVEITVNQIPVADAGPDQLLQIPGGGTADVTLNGSGSSDLDGTIPRRWRHGHGCDACGHASRRDAQRHAER